MPAQKECSCHRQYSVKEHIMTNSERNDGCTQECRDDSQYPAKLTDPWWYRAALGTILMPILMRSVQGVGSQRCTP